MCTGYIFHTISLHIVNIYVCMLHVFTVGAFTGFRSFNLVSSSGFDTSMCRYHWWFSSKHFLTAVLAAQPSSQVLAFRTWWEEKHVMSFLTRVTTMPGSTSICDWKCRRGHSQGPSPFFALFWEKELQKLIICVFCLPVLKHRARKARQRSSLWPEKLLCNELWRGFPGTRMSHIYNCTCTKGVLTPLPVVVPMNWDFLRPALWVWQ